MHLEGAYHEEVALLEKGIALAQSHSDKWLAAYSLNDLGMVTFLLGDSGEAKRLCQESLTLFRQLGDRRGTAFALANLGIYAIHVGAYREAERLHEESLELRRTTADGWGVARSLVQLGAIARATKDGRVAERYLLEVLQTACDIRVLSVMTEALVELSALLAHKGDELWALETLFAVGRYAATDRGTRDRAEALLAELRVRLPAAAVTRTEAASVALEDLADALLHASAQADELERAARDTYLDYLTPREIEVLHLVAAGMSNQELAAELGLSIRTVEWHISTIYEKIGASGKVARATATAYAFKRGFV